MEPRPLPKQKAPNNRTLVLSAEEKVAYANKLLSVSKPQTAANILDRTIHQDLLTALPLLPDNFVDLLIVDPPYNRQKDFNGSTFKEMPAADYQAWLTNWMSQLPRLLKPTASIYMCCDWQSSNAVYQAFAQYFQVRNRITWEREKGRGAKRNWKNASEDIWFGTVSDRYTFNVEAVKVQRRVRAPYRDKAGRPKDWKETQQGNFRATHPSNLWTDISIPFWSMPENTDHPTQKPEKLIAKMILASSNPGEVVFDPFLGSGTTSVVAKKLGRHYVGIEQEERYACWAQKRLALAEQDASIQGYTNGYFWERNVGLGDRRPLS
ncbi:site-specific DNA-methyltransferase [cf. Phormidesmis sp. LEGE 11477]|uniref:DNA-methyltransferase n=1 Tax=cf. Phormidesmis sp. LEGE 11477 TaxID=1828680 RepID=UPI00187DDE8E|nr:site-specific DNA-methyltransferase [cf. Phormidesmis sp. LEGE 11477]